jgi:hypothetical protein
MLAAPMDTGDDTRGHTEHERRAANLHRVAALFRERPNQWIESRSLEAIGGRCAWRTRVSECRTRLSMNIRNRQDRGRDVVLSWYLFVPPSAAGVLIAATPVQSDLFELRRGCFSE